ncbi:J domain-containing protein [Roseospira navarrensis]|uniref:J domain-containing protein n=1 Tax=Roseospira navarrensis TaxID=140058 RepID=UPI001FE98648|nr:J domain-containing protein [Roseospira navarrensis]
MSSYFRFCLEHVRAYNKAWNYYAGMSEAEIEAQLRTSTIWDRPTWRMGGTGHGVGQDPRRFSPEYLRDPLGIFAAAREAERRREHEAASPFARDSKETRALGELELTWPVSREDLRARYRVLVKRYHPDANNGAKEAEERFKRISEAYRVLLPLVSA